MEEYEMGYWKYKAREVLVQFYSIEVNEFRVKNE